MELPSGVFLLLMLVMSMVASAALLFWTWLANRQERVVLYGAHGFILAAIGVMLLGMRAFLPLPLSVIGGHSFLVLGSTLLYAGICLFNRRRFPFLIVVGLPLLLILALSIPAVFAVPHLRFSVASAMCAIVYVITAVEVLRPQDGLRSRWPLTLALGLQAVLTLGRIPIALVADPPIFTLQGFGIALIAVESMIFAQVISYLVISLPKERVEQALQRAALTDSLTGLPNRRAFYDSAERVLTLAARRRRSVSLILFDLDRFKQLTDTHGHATGDAALLAFADVLTRTLRGSDYCGRIGGEEFAVILMETSAAEARHAAERVVDSFAEQGIEHEGHRVPVTVSAGAACCLDGTSRMDDLFARADRAL